MKNLKNIITGILLVIFAFSLFQCSDNQELEDMNSLQNLELRSNDSLLNFLGTSCVPGLINVGLGCNDVEYIDTLVINDLPNYPDVLLKLFIKGIGAKH